ncbi:hypothetical protein M8542_32425 [Amycolatopsis sp. OK19-0408]|uniref:Uncharacterized protein n=1 Tax=Amycolatopsis iheyensis TaxID=2945988 RepID=A0A9X2NF26_9PSEU|nr:hypothetical protein [Amycolatopsis iheyensis]MCR6487544.1 hypothetical protein [Amycolatopsis iheyensis]
MRDHWQEPVLVLRLGDTDVGFAVPGRRLDGTVAGKRLVRRFFWNVLRGIGGAAVVVFSLAHGALAHPFGREVRVTGPAGAQALGLLDELRRTKAPWLVCAPGGVALVDTGSTYLDPADAPEPKLVWEARKPDAPEFGPRGRTLTWPDGSVFRFPLHGNTEDRHLRAHFEPPDVIHWSGRPASRG